MIEVFVSFSTGVKVYPFSVSAFAIEGKTNGKPLFYLLVLRSKDTGEETKISVSKQKYNLLKGVLS